MVKLNHIQNNFYELVIGEKCIFFSYETPIGIKLDKNGIILVYVSTNEWSKTTGKHINKLKNEFGAVQVPHHEFTQIIQIETVWESV